MKPYVVISDLDLVKEITGKHFDKFTNRMVSNCMVYVCCLIYLWFPAMKIQLHKLNLCAVVKEYCQIF